MPGLLDFLAPGNPFSGWLNANRDPIVSGFQGMVGAGNDPRQALTGYTKGLQHGRDVQTENAIIQQKQAAQEAEIAREQENQNATREWLMNNGFEQYAGLPAAQGFQLAMADLEQSKPTANQSDYNFYANQEIKAGRSPMSYLDWTNNGSGGSTEYGLTPQWYEFQGEDGKPQYSFGVLGKDGTFKEVEPPAGAKFMDPRTISAERAYGAESGGTNAERDLQAPVTAVNNQRLDAQTDNVIATVDKAIGQTGWGSSGFLGGLTGGIAGMPAYDLRQTVQTVKANLGFAELQAMREASPTGGALGQVAVQELDALQSTLASLDPNQSPEQLIENLTLVKQLLERQKQYRKMAAEAKYGSTSTVPPTAGGDDVEAILRGLGL